MDAGHGVIDKFSPSGEYLSQITGFEPATGSAEHELLGLAVDAGGMVRADASGVADRGHLPEGRVGRRVRRLRRKPPDAHKQHNPNDVEHSRRNTQRTAQLTASRSGRRAMII